MSADLLTLERTKHGSSGTSSADAAVVTLWLEQPGSPVVVLNRSMIAQIDTALDAIEPAVHSGAITGFVLASRGRVFVAGADLHEINGLTDPELDAYLSSGSRVFGRLSQLACPTVAAINGAVLGGGLELAMHCDFLVASIPDTKSTPYLVGLPEAGLGICPGWGGSSLLPARLAPSEALLHTAKGKPYKVTQAVDLGLFDATSAPGDALLDTARVLASTSAPPVRDGCPSRHACRPAIRQEVASALATCPLPDTPPAQAVAKAVQAGLDDGFDAATAAERRSLIELRSTPPAQERITGFLQKGRR